VTDARAWIDAASGRNLGSEFELPLRKVAKERWQGLFIMDDLHPGPFFYRVALLAHPGAEWSLRLHDHGLGADLLLDADLLATSKCCFIGTCHVGGRLGAQQQPERGPTAPAG
jgi:hypothetical protein